MHTSGKHALKRSSDSSHEQKICKHRDCVVDMHSIKPEPLCSEQREHDHGALLLAASRAIKQRLGCSSKDW